MQKSARRLKSWTGKKESYKCGGYSPPDDRTHDSIHTERHPDARVLLSNCFHLSSLSHISLAFDQMTVKRSKKLVSVCVCDALLCLGPEWKQEKRVKSASSGSRPARAQRETFDGYKIIALNQDTYPVPRDGRGGFREVMSWPGSVNSRMPASLSAVGNPSSPQTRWQGSLSWERTFRAI